LKQNDLTPVAETMVKAIERQQKRKCWQHSKRAYS